ncbi:hypothetical protein MSAN_00326300 [Mycena sanguinolenta]|uniref:Protein kinase domain-containing protein n=1 Tax=Mycena sanguinolenta TaxID=230812 RepID=A0A8H6ZBM6_9AGAR|nr:hypothetical protein MSAN_00326300 [Mycena sanguinolenta]
MHRPVGESSSSSVGIYGGAGGNGGGGGVQGRPGGPGLGLSVIQSHLPPDNAHQLAACAGPSGPSQTVAASSRFSVSEMADTVKAFPQNTSLSQDAVYSESGNYCSPPQPSRLASVMPTRVLVYEALISCLKDVCDAGIPSRSPRDAQLHTTLDGYLLSMASDDIVSGIVESVEHLKTLLELSAELGLANDSRLRMALHRDEERIATLLVTIFTSKSLEDVVLRLESDSAQCFLDVVQRGLLFDPEDGRMARRIIRKLACSSDKLPSTLFITGITGKEERPTSGGGFADIYRALYDNRIVALKYLRVTQYMCGSDLRKVRSKFCREALVWKELVHHPHILPFLGIEKNSFPSALSMVSPWMKHGTVLNYLKQHGHSNVDKLVGFIRLSFALQSHTTLKLYEIAQGLQYLHSRAIVHGDLRGANILINDDWSACLADFGLSIFSDATSLLTTSRGGSHYWMAPELLAPEQFGMRFARTPASDVYSFGCVCFELYTGKPPFSRLLAGAMMEVMKGERPPRPSSSPAMSDSLWAYVSTYWAQDPKTRPVMQIVAQNMIWPQPPPEEERPTKDPHTIAGEEQNQRPSNLGQTYSELQQAIFERFEILEEDGAAFLRAKSDPTAPRNAATITKEEQCQVHSNIADDLGDNLNLLSQTSPCEIFPADSEEQGNYSAESPTQTTPHEAPDTTNTDVFDHYLGAGDSDVVGISASNQPSSPNRPSDITTASLSYQLNGWPPPPPATESDEERLARVEAEREAKRISDAIDEALALERDQRKRPSNAKILLLGLRYFCLENPDFNSKFHSSFISPPKAFQAEAEGWRPVIHLNLVRSVNFVLGLFEIRHPSTYNGDAQPTSPDGALSDQLRRLSISLAPLRQVEETLSNRIAGPRPPVDSRGRDRYHPAKAPEISLRAGSGWTFLRFWRGSSLMPDRKEKAEELQTRRILSACAQDIMMLWASPEVQQGLEDLEIVLREQSGFFLDEVQRICQENYIPTPDDILRARVHTVGPEEHFINVEGGGHTHLGSLRSLTVYDLGGSTSQRPTWAQFFDDVHVIIFLAPISAFNEILAENPTVNRLEDSVQLWRTICRNKLLTTVEFILLLNKVDILTRKIQSGIRFADHVTSYRNKPNEPKDIISYLSDKFAAINKTHSRRKRKIHRHVTCAIDTKATAAVIVYIYEVILMNALKATSIL